MMKQIGLSMTALPVFIFTAWLYPAYATENTNQKKRTPSSQSRNCPSQFVTLANDTFRLPISAVSCTGFLGAYDKDKEALYSSAAMISLAEKTDQACRYRQSIGTSAPGKSSRAEQIRLGRLQFENHYRSYINARAYPDYKAANVMMGTINNFHSTCSAIMKFATTELQPRKPAR